MGDYIREEIDMVLVKYQQELESAKKKGGEMRTIPDRSANPLH
jgi:hypothetical protein